MRLSEFRNVFKDQTVTLIGGAVTTVDYEQLAHTGTAVVVLINWALRLAPLFNHRRHKLFFFTWHLEMFAALEELHTPHMLVAVSKWSAHAIPRVFANPTIDFEPTNILPYPVYLWSLQQWAKEGESLITDYGVLPSCANTTLLALMFVWYTGCREINVVGMHDIGGVQQPHYDLRLRATNAPSNAYVYNRDLTDFCRIMGMTVNYLGDR